MDKGWETLPSALQQWVKSELVSRVPQGLQLSNNGGQIWAGVKSPPRLVTVQIAGPHPMVSNWAVQAEGPKCTFLTSIQAAATAADLGATLRKSEVNVQRLVTNTPNGWVRYDDLMTDFNPFEMFPNFEFYWEVSPLHMKYKSPGWFTYLAHRGIDDLRSGPRQPRGF